MQACTRSGTPPHGSAVHMLCARRCGTRCTPSPRTRVPAAAPTQLADPAARGTHRPVRCRRHRGTTTVPHGPPHTAAPPSPLPNVNACFRGGAPRSTLLWPRAGSAQGGGCHHAPALHGTPRPTAMRQHTSVALAASRCAHADTAMQQRTHTTCVCNRPHLDPPHTHTQRRRMQRCATHHPTQPVGARVPRAARHGVAQRGGARCCGTHRWTLQGHHMPCHTPRTRTLAVRGHTPGIHTPHTRDAGGTPTGVRRLPRSRTP